MAVSEYHLDTRIRRHHVPLITQQRRLRHLRSISARNISSSSTDKENNLAVAFTLHLGVDMPAFYTSEVVRDNVNPSWKEFESSNLPDSVDTASTYVIVRIWNVEDERKLVIEWIVFFSGLVYLGEQIPKEGKNFKPDTIIFGMSEGYYGCNDCYQNASGNVIATNLKKELEADATGLRTSYTLCTLSRIKTVERAIKQTRVAVQRRRNSINARLQSSQEMHQLYAQRELLKIRTSILRTELQYQQQCCASLEKDITEYKTSLSRKRDAITNKAEEQKKHIEKCVELSKFHNECRETFLKTDAQLNLRRKQLISELSFIYPIVEFPDRNGYSIRSVHLPDSENFAGHDDVMIAVALGYVCHSVLMISQFLNVPLRYLINFYGSRSSIMDHISSCLPDNSREFPLHVKSRDRKPFEYGVFLLNKDIAQLRILCRMTTKDLSATLPNLSSLIELKFSTTNDDHSIPSYGPIDKRQLLKPTVNGIDNTNQSVSSIELKQEIAAMLPDNSNTTDNLQVPLSSKDVSSALSSSLDKGLNEIKLLEKSLETLEMESKDTRAKKMMQTKLMAHHHSSYPNLNKSLSVPDTNGVSSHLLNMPSRLWTAESSRTNSEDEPLEEDARNKRSSVLNDSIFYIPSGENTKNEPWKPDDTSSAVDKVLVDDEFSADLTLRTQQLSDRKASFQLQKLRSSSIEEQLSNL